MPWEQERPVEVPITIAVQCYPRESQTKCIRRPIHELALALLAKGQLRAYEIAHALDTVGQFWERVGSGDAELEDFEDDFDGDKRRARKKAAKWLAHAILILEPGDECPLCKSVHVAIDADENIVCVGECGVVREAPEPETEPDGSQGEQDAKEEEEGSGHDDRSISREEEDQGDG